ncbi:MAG: hypothetical protein ACLRNW_01820 [Neglectibacter sp.]
MGRAPLPEQGRFADPKGEARYDRDKRENAAKKKENRIDLSQPDPKRWAKEDLERTKRTVDASANLAKELKKLDESTTSKPTPKRMDLSKMSDKEMRDQINRELLERQYNQLFAEVPAAQVSKGREALKTTLEVASVLAMRSALGIALAIKELKG